MVRKVLLVGNGAREHAIAQALCASKDVQLYAYMSARNPGIEALCKKSKGATRIGDIHLPLSIAWWATNVGIDLAFPSPDAVLAAGVGDELAKHNVPIAAPIRAAARIEWDKAYLRNLMGTYRVPGCPRYGYFKEPGELDGFIDTLGGQVAVKPVGLTGGKGVRVVGHQLRDGAEAKYYAREVLANKIGGGDGVLIEEKLEGEEFTLQAFVDGRTVLPMPCVQDHKRAYDGDLGPNCGGMGSYSGPGHLLPFLAPSHYEHAVTVMEKIARAFDLDSHTPYRGILYGQFMAGPKGVMLVEVNARFGDPEAINVLSLLKTPLADILEKVADGKLRHTELKWGEAATVVKYLVPDGYPVQSVPPSPLKIDVKNLKASKASLYYASVDARGEQLYTGSSRSIAVLGMGKTLAEAEKRAEAGCKSVSGPVWHRPDIGTAKLIGKRIEHMGKIRGR